MNPIAIKHRDSWPDLKETYILDCRKVKFIVFHGTMFDDDDTDIYGIIAHDGTQQWIMTRFLNGEDYATLSRWLETYFDLISTLNDDHPPIVVWPIEHAGTLFFDQSYWGRFIGTYWLFPGCYEKREVAKELQDYLASSFTPKKPHPKRSTPLSPPQGANPESDSGK